MKKITRGAVLGLATALILTAGVPAVAGTKTVARPAAAATIGGLPASPGTRIAVTFNITPNFSAQGWNLSFPPGKTPLATGYLWGPDTGSGAGTPSDTGVAGLPQPKSVTVRSTNARLFPVNSRDGYVWRVYLILDATDCDVANANGCGQVTLWGLYL